MKDPPHQILDISGHFNDLSRQIKTEPSPRILPPVRAVDPNVEKIRVKSVDEPVPGDKNSRKNNVSISSLAINEDVTSAAALDMSGIKEEDSAAKTSPLLESISSSNDLPLSNPRRLTEIQE